MGFTGQGVDENRPYKRMPDSFEPKVAFVFEGVGKDELIGDFENPVLVRGAAGFEIDRMDYELGTAAQCEAARKVNALRRLISPLHR